MKHFDDVEGNPTQCIASIFLSGRDWQVFGGGIISTIETCTVRGTISFNLHLLSMCTIEEPRARSANILNLSR
jgi:hypothetical protein